jgi:hypothetical protein
MDLKTCGKEYLSGQTDPSQQIWTKPTQEPNILSLNRNGSHTPLPVNTKKTPSSSRETINE